VPPTFNLTLPELKQRLTNQLDPNELIEVLGISSEDLVEAFSDRIEERLEELTQDFESEIENGSD
jgi:ribosome assembly protein YihI (activator of Der GTPase)